MKTPAWLGVDLGTSSLKVIAVGEDGSALAELEVALPLERPTPHEAEADPRAWTRAVDALVLPMSDTYDVRAVGVTGQMHGTVLVDESGDPVRLAILWPDSRAEAVRHRWDALPAEVLARLGSPWSPGMTGPVLAWLAEHEPGTLARAARVALPKDFVREHLVPGNATTDPSDASGTLLWDVTHEAWSPEATALVPDELLPEVGASTDVVGQWRGADVSVGGGDTPVSLLALMHAVDGWQAGDVVVNLGTGAQVIDPLADRKPGSGWSEVHLYEGVSGDRYAMVAAQNGGLAISWALDQLGLTWDELSVLYEQTPAGADGALFSPFVSGERGSLSPSAPGPGGHGPPAAGNPQRHSGRAPRPRPKPSWCAGRGSCSASTRGASSWSAVEPARGGSSNCWPTSSAGRCTTCPCAVHRPPARSISPVARRCDSGVWRTPSSRRSRPLSRTPTGVGTGRCTAHPDSVGGPARGRTSARASRRINHPRARDARRATA